MERRPQTLQVAVHQHLTINTSHLILRVAYVCQTQLLRPHHHTEGHCGELIIVVGEYAALVRVDLYRCRGTNPGGSTGAH